MTRPPRFIQKILLWFCPEHLLEGIEGDLLEQFDADVAQFGKQKARWLLALNVLRFLRPGIISRNKLPNKLRPLMLQSNFKIAFRQIRKNPTYTGINIAGLVTGIASALIILSIIRFELSFDQFHSDADSIYRIVRISDVEGETEYRSGVVYPLPAALQEGIPGLNRITSVLYWSWGGIQVAIDDSTSNSSNRLFRENDGFALVEPTFFEVLDFNDSDFKWIHGDPESALTQPYSLVLTETMANKYFPQRNAVGKTIVIDQYWHCTVTGVITDLPANTDFPFKILLSYSTLQPSIGERMDNWVSVGVNQSYLILPEGRDVKSFETLMDQIHEAHAPDIAGTRKYRLQHLSELHKDGRFDNYNRRIVSEDRLLTLGIIGVFLLLVACINYVNLATAQSFVRSKEVGIRKVMGSHRRALIVQFLCEAFVICLLSGLFGLLVAELSISNFQELLSAPGSGWLIGDPFMVACLVGIILSVTLLAGLYPAVIIAGFKPIQAIRKGFSSDQGSLRFRKVLVTFQFSVTQICLIATLVVILQTDYFSKADLGFHREAIINVTVPEDVQRQLLFNTMTLNLSTVQQTSLSSTVPSGDIRNRNFWDIRKSTSDQHENLVYELQRIDPTYLDLYGIELIAGRNFRRSDTSFQMIINKTLSDKLGFEDPRQAIGEVLHTGKDLKAEVIGVVKDFHTKSLKEGLDKVGMVQRPEDYEVANIRLASTGSIRQGLEEIQEIWTSIYPEFAFNYQFFDESVAAYYSQEQKFTTLFKIFSGVFLVICCLGLYGLIAFVIHKKLKEIAVRKVFGAKALNILMVISRDYFQLIALAFLIATPVAFYLMQRWLENYTFHINISWWMLIAPGILVGIIAILAVSGLTMKAVKANPAKILKDE